MKSKMKQTKIDRSAANWLPRAMALAATTASSQAATVQITLTGNKISSTGGNQLVADLTGDENSDVNFGTLSDYTGLYGAWIKINGRSVSAQYRSSFYYGDANFVGGGGVGESSGYSPLRKSHLNAVSFTDARINGGALTEGWLQVNAFNTSATDHTVELSRLIFDDESTTAPTGVAFTDPAYSEWVDVSAVPEPATNLGLLALGAGGLLTRRRLKRAA